VQKVAREYLTPDTHVILVVGHKDQILLGDPDHPVKLTDLAGGRLTDLPLRDPLTMKPTSQAVGAKPSSQQFALVSKDLGESDDVTSFRPGYGFGPSGPDHHGRSRPPQCE
jgi:hypothetical protein